MIRFCFLPGILILLTVGCGQAPQEPNYPEVKGTVTLDGNPLAGATVTFVPAEGNLGNRASGTTDESGQYKLRGPRGGAGAAPGAYKVAVSRWLLPDGKPPPPQAPKAGSGASESLPPYYSDALRTTMTATVPTAGGTFDFPLKGRGATK